MNHPSTPITPNDIALLRQAVQAGPNGAIYTTVAAMGTLAAYGYVEGNQQVVNPADPSQIAFRATAAGAIALQQYDAAGQQEGQQQAAAPAAATTPAPATGSRFQIITGAQAPARNMRRVVNPNANTYPFADLELGAAFFIPATDAKPDPKKSIGSTITAANKRFKEFSPRRHFRAIAVAAGQKLGEFVAPSNGCLVMRVEPPAEKPAAAPTTAAPTA